MSEIPVNLSELEAKMAKALLEINDTIYAKGALIGSDNYFKIRGICCDILNDLRRSGNLQKEER